MYGAKTQEDIHAFDEKVWQIVAAVFPLPARRALTLMRSGGHRWWTARLDHSRAKSRREFTAASVTNFR